MDGTPTVVSDVMTREVLALRTGAAFKDIVRAMREWRIGALPVLDDAGRVVGVVAAADLPAREECREDDLGHLGRVREGVDPRKATGTTAGELMTTPAATVTPAAGLGQAARLMARAGVEHLPVVAPDGTPRGIVSRSDLLKVFLRADADIAEQVRGEVVGRLFGTRSAAIGVEVHDGVVTLAGRVRETALVPLAVRLARSVPGVVDVRCVLTGPPGHPDLDLDAGPPAVERTGTR
ncbi:CBS domain-containing protein [Streptomyces sp. LP11]|uniref:CBS domain-containing protein n=1 Tax=Streptomyces pyxinicus TaxID=2970331 RepID=A0ABT2B8Q6_9ACTN|nr:CBS domain-containing protein [Streptomyces sp. LP11]MCS0604894.1 CBS domain-containing protein [Streptomyces sp. LP11]